MAGETTRHRLIVKEVTRGFFVDDEASTGKTRRRKKRKFANGWVDDEPALTEGILIKKSVQKDFYIGLRTDPDVMDRAWIESDAKSGYIVVENEIGPKHVEGFSFPGNVAHGTEQEMENELEGDYLVVKVIARAHNATDTTIRIDIESDSTWVTVATLTFSSPRGETPLILEDVEDTKAIRCEVVTAGGARNMEVKVIMRELLA